MICYYITLPHAEESMMPFFDGCFFRWIFLLIFGYRLPDYSLLMIILSPLFVIIFFHAFSFSILFSLYLSLFSFFILLLHFSYFSFFFIVDIFFLLPDYFSIDIIFFSFSIYYLLFLLYAFLCFYVLAGVRCPVFLFF